MSKNATLTQEDAITIRRPSHRRSATGSFGWEDFPIIQSGFHSQASNLTDDNHDGSPSNKRDSVLVLAEDLAESLCLLDESSAPPQISEKFGEKQRSRSPRAVSEPPLLR